jgi:hypothetical protein
MNKYTPFMDLYNRICQLGSLPENGLCSCIEGIEMRDILELFEPYGFERTDMFIMGYDMRYWASGLCLGDLLSERERAFTPLRQTILLLCAAINDEL